MTTINFTSSSTGPDGFSTKKEFLGCPARAVIKEKKAREDWAAGIRSFPPYPEEKNPVAPTVGSMLGHLCQMYHAGTPEPVRAECLWDGVSIEKSHPKTVAEVWRLYDFYVSKHSVDHWGKFVAQEVQCEIPAEVFGERLTCAIDLVTEVDGEHVLNDFKWLAREEETVWDEYALTLQQFAYRVAYEIKTGIPVRRIRYLTGFKRKENPDIKAQEYIFDEGYHVRWIKNFIDMVRTKRGSAKPEPSPSNCLGFKGQHCAMLIAGKCSLL